MGYPHMSVKRRQWVRGRENEIFCRAQTESVKINSKPAHLQNKCSARLKYMGIILINYNK